MLLTDERTEALQQDRYGPISHIFSKGCTNTPQKTAVSDGKRSYTFQELQSKSDSLFNMLINAGVKPGDRVVVLAQKRIEMTLVAPAIWKAGAIYVPLDSDSPHDRLNGIIVTTEAKVLIGTPENIADFPATKLTLIAFDAFAESDENESPIAAYACSNDDEIAYMIHTSGTTGKPKGVCISHGNLRSYFANHNEIFNFKQDSFCFSFSPFHFDVSIEDTFLPLAYGASVYVYKGLPIQSLILKALAKNKITHVIAVSTILTIMTTDKDKILNTDLSHLQLLMTGAEVCDTYVIDFWNNNFPDLRVINAYGPTETTIVSHCYTIPKRYKEDKDTFYPIGKPLRNNTSILLDNTGKIILNSGETGELLIGGTQVMKGYYNRQQETENVLTKIDGNLYYRTGDLCFQDNEGNYHFVGRTDDEIKLFGRRVNLLEIQHELLSNSIFESGIVDVQNVNGQKKLFAIVVGETANAFRKLSELDEQLKQLLPSYMVPSYYACTEQAVLSSTGKNNLKSLMKPFLKAVMERSDKFYSLNDEHVELLEQE